MRLPPSGTKLSPETSLGQVNTIATPRKQTIYCGSDKEKRLHLVQCRRSHGRSGGIRTRGLLVPNQTRYQTALHLVTGADNGTRTHDLLITNQPLYQLSYIGASSKGYYSRYLLLWQDPNQVFSQIAARKFRFPCRRRNKNAPLPLKDMAGMHVGGDSLTQFSISESFSIETSSTERMAQRATTMVMF